ANDGWTFRFASQVKALLAGGGVSRDPEPAGLVGFHLYGSVPEPFSLYREIRSLPAGHTQWIDAAGPREAKCFANLAAILADAAAQPSIPQAESAALVRQVVLDSVKAHLLADVEVGAFLSAGVDSGALLGLMRDAGQSEIRAITLAFEEFQNTSEDEAPLAARVAERYGAHHIVRYVGEREFRQDLPAILESMDQPSIDGVNTWFVSKASREAGLKVAISGLGGDELFAGYPSFVELPRWRRFGRFTAGLGIGRLARTLIRAALPSLTSARPKATAFFEYAGSWAGAYLLRRGLFLPHELSEMMDADVAREGLHRLDPLGRLAKSLVPDPGSNVARICALESSHYMRNQLLRDADWAGMAHSLEIRVPLVDASLLRSLAPVIAGMVPGAGKEALAMSPSLPLPDEIIRRAKTGFGVPTGAWMRAAAGETQSSAGNSTQSKGLVSRRWLRLVLARLEVKPQAALAP
ncbi:asparagine synthetase B family protein, partial [Pseudomonas sp.]|uniref:asparagine synthetase B family protein n=1 Tax=Pseudomonas sp. TaxID=306 RepID=UPI003C631A4C